MNRDFSRDTTRRVLILRADAGVNLGVGHLMRCLALGQAWKDVGGEVVFITHGMNACLTRQLYEEEFSVHHLEHSYPGAKEWPVTREILSAYPQASVVLDGYHFDTEYHENVKVRGHRLMVVDDMAHLPRYCVDILLNQNAFSEDQSQLYGRRDPFTKFLLGPRYGILRREFLKWRGWKREIPERATKLLVTLGGSDPPNVTLRVIRAVRQLDLPGITTVIVAGPNNPHREELRDFIDRMPPNFRLVSNTSKMPEWMAWADLAVSAGGITCWESAFMKLPALFFAISENQRLGLEGIAKRGVGVNLGWHEHVSELKIVNEIWALLNNPEMRTKIARHSEGLVDGRGPLRVLNHLFPPEAPSEACNFGMEFGSPPGSFCRETKFCYRNVS